jgi:hypothetical protein
MTSVNVPRRSAVENLSVILDSAEISRLIEALEATRWTGRPGYALRALVGMTLVKSLYAIPTWTRTVALVREHAALAAIIALDGQCLRTGRATASWRNSESTEPCSTPASRR